MKRVTWPELGLNLSRLAFGCAPVMGRVSERVALDAMTVAYERGVTHFDVARSYGFGDAERVLGRFVADKRSKITVATKFGILPTGVNPAKKLVKPLLRIASRCFPGFAQPVRKTAGKSLVRGFYDLESAQRSLEISLAELRLDAVDILFVHDCRADDEITGTLAAWLDALIGSGKIRAWGLATGAADITPTSRRLGRRPGIVQIPCNEHGLVEPGPVRKILHSSLAPARRFYDDQDRPLPAAAGWARQAGLDEHQFSEALPRLLLRSALQKEKEAVVLCSMFTRSHIRANIEDLDEGDGLADLVPSFSLMAASVLDAHPGGYGSPVRVT